ncbi:hypothetical protein [Corynebacterium poyangense]|uniref:hypothetical protein n=1 Tax=Corynebacterium poyangense TaxID=2684405 RepID=UPI003743401D
MKARPSPAPTCEWCGTPIKIIRRGRPKKYCSASCRQQAYQHRQQRVLESLPTGSIIIPPEQVEEYRDDLYALRCAAEDMVSAVHDGADYSEMKTLCQELVVLARKVEKFR